MGDGRVKMEGRGIREWEVGGGESGRRGGMHSLKQVVLVGFGRAILAREHLEPPLAHLHVLHTCELVSEWR